MASRSSRSQKIEPLDYAEMAQAPALKGSISLLEITPNDVHSGFSRFSVSAGHEKTPGDLTCPGDATSLEQNTHQSNLVSTGSRRKPITLRPQPLAIRPATLVSAADTTSPRIDMWSGDISTPGDETPIVRPSSSVQNVSDALTPGRGRSKVRRCVLAQDGHSLGEEAIYQVLWRGGRQETSDPNGSRAVRMGAADIGYKVNMAKKNVRQNISKLFEKLALEILEDFETISSQPRLYRVYSYKQILERRRVAGLEFVLRNKGVVFCSRDGAGLVSSPAYVTAPGDETSLRPAPPKKRRSPLPPSPAPASQLPYPQTDSQTEDADLLSVSQALNRYWPVDQPAAEHLLRACRRVRPDARADEISFFVREKLELARQNRTITNPIGLILSTVPQSFVGSTFLEFRKRMERQAALAAEEVTRKEREAVELKEWLDKERDEAAKTLSDETKSQKQREAAERTLRQLGPREF
ncbi:MAG: hypothetical protein ACRYFU_22780 [Janthinobacterium lividum]